MLYLIEGPAGGGKSQLARDMKEAGEIHLVADITGLWAAVTLAQRGPDGKYPPRLSNDPGLDAARYLQTTLVRFGLSQGLNVGVTTSQGGQIPKWQSLADSMDTFLGVRTVDPGQSVARERLADANGNLDPECEDALARWYG